MTQKVLLIIPAFNEEKSIKKTIESVKSYDFIVINDGSTDKTEQILRENSFNHIELLSNLGIGGAVQTGYKYAYENNYDIAIQFDADGQHDAKYLPNLIAPIKNGSANLVIGSCFLDKSQKSARSSKIRRVGIAFLSSFIFTLSGKRITDPTSGFRAADQKTIEFFAKNYPLEYPEAISNFELLKKSGFKVQEIPVTMHKRANGKSSIHSWKSIYAALNVIISILILGIKRHD